MNASAGRLSLWLLLTPFLLWIVLLVLVPHLQMLRVSFQVRESWERLLEAGAVTIYPAHGKPFDADKLRGM